MPKITRKILAQAIGDALRDRKSYLEAVAGIADLTAETQSEHARILALRGKSFGLLTPGQSEAARLAFVYAEQYQNGVVAAHPNGPERAAARKLAATYRALRLDHWGETAGEVEVESWAVVNYLDYRRDVLGL